MSVESAAATTTDDVGRTPEFLLQEWDNFVRADGNGYKLVAGTAGGLPSVKPLVLESKEQLLHYNSDVVGEIEVKSENVVLRVDGNGKAIWFAPMVLREGCGEDDFRILRRLGTSPCKKLVEVLKVTEPSSPLLMAKIEHEQSRLREYVSFGCPFVYGVCTSRPPPSKCRWLEVTGEEEKQALDVATAPLPDRDAVLQFVAENDLLLMILRRLQGGGSLDVTAENITESDEEYGYVMGLSLAERARVVPYLRRLGFHVDWFVVRDQGPHILTASTPGYLRSLRERNAEKGGWISARWPFFEVHLPARSFRRAAQIGVLRCVPKLLALLRRARISLAAPSRLDMEKEAESAMDTSAASDVFVRPDEEQKTLKRKLHEALFCSDEEKDEGARWAGISSDGATAGSVKPMRIEAVVGDLFVFRKVTACGSGEEEEVVAIPDRDFTVHWHQNAPNWKGSGLEWEVEARRGHDVYAGVDA
jgi:hypothetical protein|mmetsp:Transcript_4585/g.10604  ORF Transcript_4585/g.10604 Transcript_4585/m.10604 type:complete len:475 (-) Transcript_4585:329-1753(-)